MIKILIEWACLIAVSAAILFVFVRLLLIVGVATASELASDLFALYFLRSEAIMAAFLIILTGTYFGFRALTKVRETK